eukprot:TRINITY_DN762_c0_g1_i1.p1 TRINITY_DN762_c0_g1~~TRINITY_DN762_c0_g1_i1.p1  ORF type:complete len:236 (-),score=22.31 TRINITY_DN762_c0_g1_i1:32-739(-)
MYGGTYGPTSPYGGTYGPTSPYGGAYGPTSLYGGDSMYNSIYGGSSPYSAPYASTYSSPYASAYSSPYSSPYGGGLGYGSPYGMMSGYGGMNSMMPGMFGPQAGPPAQDGPFAAFSRLVFSFGALSFLLQTTFEGLHWFFQSGVGLLERTTHFTSELKHAATYRGKSRAEWEAEQQKQAELAERGSPAHIRSMVRKTSPSIWIRVGRILINFMPYLLAILGLRWLEQLRRAGVRP